MDAGLKNGTVTQQQYDAWQREIIETENELKNLQRYQGRRGRHTPPQRHPLFAARL
jgi:hypothetical protein